MTAPERGPAGTWQYLLHWDGGAAALGASLGGLPASDYDAACLIAAERGGDGLHYAATSGVWHIWNGQAHLPDAGNGADQVIAAFGARMRTAIEAARQAVTAEVILRMPPGSTEAAMRQAREQAWAPWKPAEKYAAGLARQAGKAALGGYLETICGVPDDALAERSPGRLNLANGTLDLATLQLRPHARSDLITYALADPWEPRAVAPRFWSLLSGVCGHDGEVSGFLLKCLGYSLLGDNREQKIFFIAGPSGSGKSVLLHVVSEVLGPLAHRSGSDLICVVRHGRNARTENSVRGTRLVVITETSKFMNIDEAQLKQMTGEPVISVNQHYAKAELKTPVTWTIWVATNDMPALLNYDMAMRRRILVIPGGPGRAELDMDPHMAAKILSTERQGVLALLARGCAEYFRSGLLDVPWAVREATELYAAEQNTVANFVADTMVTGGWGDGVPQHQAWELYELWSRGSSRLGRNDFMKYLSGFPGVSWNKMSRRFEGVAWNADWAARVV